MAEIALKKAQAIRDTFQAGLFRADTAQRELKKLADETGMFDSISEEEIAANTGKTYQDVTALRDPLAGLGYGGEISAPFEGAAQDALTWDYSPSQPRDKKGDGQAAAEIVKLGKQSTRRQRGRTSGGKPSQPRPSVFCGVSSIPNIREPKRDNKVKSAIRASGIGLRRMVAEV